MEIDCVQMDQGIHFTIGNWLRILNSHALSLLFFALVPA